MKTELTVQNWGRLIGCKVIESGTGTIDTYTANSLAFMQKYELELHRYSEIKPILRTLDQMSVEEKEEFINMFYERNVSFKMKSTYIEFLYMDGSYKKVYYEVQHYDYLDSTHVDIRGYIEAGLAVKYNAKIHGGCYERI